MGHDPIGAPTLPPTPHTPTPLLSQNADLFCTSSLSLLQTSPSGRWANSGGLLRMTTGGEGFLPVLASLGSRPGNIQNFIEHFFFAVNASLLMGPD